MNQKIKKLRDSFKDNSGETNLTKVIIISIMFVIGAILVGAVVSAINGSFGEGMAKLIRDIMH